MTEFPILLRSAALHIPDGFLSVPVAVVGIVAMVLVVAYTLRKTGDLLGERQIPLLGVMAAFVFAAQTINFPVLGGTSGHLLGGALVAIVLGPWPAVLVMTTVVGLQALIFQDGGLLALGWNVVNMAVLSVLTATLTFGILRRWLGEGRRAMIVATMAAAWLSVLVSATATGVELAISDPGLLPAVPAMAGVHTVIGLGEALITAAAVFLISRSRPAMLSAQNGSRDHRTAYVMATGLLVALVVGLFSVVSSPLPDGLESVAIELGFAERAEEPILNLLADYSLPGSDSALGGIVVIAAGTILAFCLLLFLAWAIRRVTVSKSVVRAQKENTSLSGD